MVFQPFAEVTEREFFLSQATTPAFQTPPREKQWGQDFEAKSS